MKPQDFINLVLADEPQIAAAISTGAAFEIWLQVELMILLRKVNLQAARELPYPDPYKRWSLDAAIQDQDGLHAIELKVESATNAGKAVVTAMQLDAVKITNYTQDNVKALSRWVIAVAYSDEAKKAMQQLAANDPKKMTAYFDGPKKNIGLLMQIVP